MKRISQFALQAAVFVLSLTLTALMVLSFDTVVSHAQSSVIVITRVSISDNQAIIEGDDLPGDGAVIEINGVAAAKTKRKGRRNDGTAKRLRATDGRLVDINDSGDQGVFRVLDTITGQFSDPFIVNSNARPRISSLQNGAGVVGTTVNAVIEGRNLVGAVVSLSGEGVTPSAGVTFDPARLPVTISIAPNAVAGPRTVTVTTSGGSIQKDSINFTVVGQGTNPIVSGINPSRATRGGSTDAVITGFRLNGASAVSFGGAGVTASILSGGSETNLPIRITIGANADLGPRAVSVATSGGVSSESISLTVDNGAPTAQVQLTMFAQVGGSSDIYHMTEAPDGSYFVAQFSSSSLVRLSSSGTVLERQSGAFLFPTSVAFFSQDVGYTSCNPAPLASRGFCLSGNNNCPRGEGVDPGNINGVSVPRYMLGADDSLTSRTFLISNGGTGEIRRVDPVTRNQTVIAGGFTRASVNANTRGPEQIAYNRRTRTIFVPDSGKGTIVAIDEATSNQTVLRSGLNYPFGLILLDNGNLLISNRGDGTLVEIGQQGQPVNTYDTGMGADALRGLTVNSRGDVFLLVDKTQTIFRVDFR